MEYDHHSNYTRGHFSVKDWYFFQTYGLLKTCDETLLLWNSTAASSLSSPSRPTKWVKSITRRDFADRQIWCTYLLYSCDMYDCCCCSNYLQAGHSQNWAVNIRTGLISLEVLLAGKIYGSVSGSPLSLCRA